MYQNKAILMGFLGIDAEIRTGKNDQKFTTFSLATKTSYKNKESGEYISHTEWHRCIVFGKFGEFAATLKKGAHIQVEGEIRHTEFTPKKAKKPVRSDSVRVTSILKLDRAEKAAPEDLENELTNCPRTSPSRGRPSQRRRPCQYRASSSHFFLRCNV